MTTNDSHEPSKKRRGRARTKLRTIAHTKQRHDENDGVYLVKLVAVALISTLWLKFATPIAVGWLVLTALPLGLIAVLLAVRTLEKDLFERRIWYAVALVIAIVTYFVPAGFVI